MDESSLVEVSNVIYSYTWDQIHKRKDKIKHFLSTKINKEPIQQILEQSGFKHHQMYYVHLLEIEKSYEKYIDSLNAMAQIIPSLSSSTDTIAAYDRVISSWQLLANVNDDCNLDIPPLPNVTDTEYRMRNALKRFQDAIGKQLRIYIWFTLCLCFIVITGIGSKMTRLLVVLFGSVYFMIRVVLFVCDTSRILAVEIEHMKVWLELKQEINSIHQDLFGLTELLHDTIECVKSMWVEKKLQRMETMQE